ncbi:MAG: anaerobic ribonucleoside triphosphate reductase [Clostridiales bacterium]|nr:anaerobic ribonucleoside triphosphate reductase [Clostridiales bacterium]
MKLYRLDGFNLREELSDIVVIKRDGKRVKFDSTKIAVAIKKGFEAVDSEYTLSDINKVFYDVIDVIKDGNYDKIKIEQIQDIIEEIMNQNGYIDIAKAYSEYREKRAQSRELFFDEKKKHKFLKALENIGLDSKNGNADEYDFESINNRLIEYGEIVSEKFATAYIMKKKFSELHENGDIYIKNIKYYPFGTTENCQINLEKLFQNGFSTKRCSMRVPQSIVSYSMLALVAITNNQKDQFGEQSIPSFDYYMAPGVLKTFKKEFKQTIYDILDYTDFDKFIALNGIEREIEKINSIDFDISVFYKFTRESEQLKRMFRIVYEKAMKKTNKQVYQSMEGFVHDLNSICSECLTTINIGTDISAEGRIISFNLLRAISEGLGENRKAISPKVVFKVKKGINFSKEDVNYDLFLRACEVVKDSDNISFSFLDSDINTENYKIGDFNTEVAYFENGTRIIDNFVDSDRRVSAGRGVIATTVLNLPRIALKSDGNLELFMEELERKLDLVKDQLIESYEIQSNKKVKSFPFLMKEHVWIDSERFEDENMKIKKALKHGLLQVSFTGLNEALIVLNGKSHFESIESQKIGIKIVRFIANKVNEYVNKYNLNFVVAGNEDDEISKSFVEIDRVLFGNVKYVTDKVKYTNSFEVSESFDIKKKIEVESEYHNLTNGGHKITISSNNIEDTVKLMYKNNIGYGVINYKK